MTALLSAALFWGGCVFWLSVVATVVWVSAVEVSDRRALARRAEAANRYKAGRVPSHDAKRAYWTFSTIEGRRRSSASLRRADVVAKYGRGHR